MVAFTLRLAESERSQLTLRWKSRRSRSRMAWPTDRRPATCLPSSDLRCTNRGTTARTRRLDRVVMHDRYRKLARPEKGQTFFPGASILPSEKDRGREITSERA